MRARRIHIALATTAVAAGSLLTAGAPAASPRIHIEPAAPATIEVEVTDDIFTPATAKVARGGTVVFVHLGGHHTATDWTGMDLFDSGAVDKDSPPTFVSFPAAGWYPYVCVLHAGMVGRVNVPIRAVPVTGSASLARRITWAVASADTGYVYDVQIKRPGKHWRFWRRAVGFPDATFTGAGDGRYRFRSRMREPGQGRSRWSSPADIVVG